MSTLLLIARVALGAVFAVAAIGKLVDRDGSREAAERFGVGTRVAGPFTIGLPVVELGIAIGLILTATFAWAAVAAAALLVMFSVALVRAIARGDHFDCHCLGAAGSAHVGPAALVRNLGLLAVAGFVAVAGSHTGGESVLSAAADLGAVAIVLGIAMIIHGAFSWQLLKQNGRLLERVSDLEDALKAGREPPAGQLAIGDPAPTFALPDLNGRTVSLQELLRPGRGVVLVFTDPACAHCNPLLPALGQPRSNQQPALAVISRGVHEENQARAQEHGIAPLLLQRDFEVGEAYGNGGLPGAVLIDAEGRIASERAAGAKAVGDLVHAAATPQLAVLNVTDDHATGSEVASPP